MCRVQKREEKISVVKELAKKEFGDSEMILAEILLELSDCVTEICDPDHGKEVTRIYENLTLHNIELMKGLVKERDRDLTKELEECQKKLYKSAEGVNTYLKAIRFYLEEIKKLKKKVENYRKNIMDTWDQTDDLLGELSICKMERDECQKKLYESANDVNTYLKEIKELNKRVENYRKNIMDTWDQTDDLLGELSICKMERNDLFARYNHLVKKLALCERERDEERRAKEQAEYDKEYFANELSENR